MARQRCVRCGSKFAAEASRCPACSYDVAKPAAAEKPASTGDGAAKNFAYFIVPLIIEICLAIVHFTHAFGLYPIPEAAYNLLAFLTIVYTIVLFAIGVLSVTSSALEDLRRKIIEEKNEDLAWVRDYFRAVRKVLPVYNKSLSDERRAMAGLIVSGVYVLVLALNGFIGTAATTLFSIFLVWFGNKIIRDYHVRGSSKPKKDAQGKRSADEEAETLTPDSTHVPRRSPMVQERAKRRI